MRDRVGEFLFLKDVYYCVQKSDAKQIESKNYFELFNSLEIFD